MKAKMVFDSRRAGLLKQTIGLRAELGDCVCLFSQDSLAKQINSHANVPFMVAYSTEGTPTC